MSKTTVTRLFAAAILATVAGMIMTAATIVTAISGGAVTFGGSSVMSVNGSAIAGVLGWMVIASLISGLGVLAALASWIGALVNTFQLDDKTWFLVLLALGLCSFGWIAMVAYVIAGPDSAVQRVGHGVATVDAT
jgi:hypothetical protein